MTRFLLTTLVFTGIFAGMLYLATPALAQYGLDETAQEAGLNTSGSLPSLVGGVIGTALSLIGIVFFILLVYAGFMWMTSRGNPEINKKALNTIGAAVIGLIIVLASYAITQLVLSSIGGAGAAGGGTASGPAPIESGGPDQIACNCFLTSSDSFLACAEFAVEEGSVAYSNPDGFCSTECADRLGVDAYGEAVSAVSSGASCPA